MRCLAVIAGLALAIQLRAQAAPDRSALNLVGDAIVMGARIRLVPAEPDRVGAAWFSEKQLLANGFVTFFSFQITHTGGLSRGADGLAFVLHNGGPHALGSKGSGGGFTIDDQGNVSIVPQSIATFFDLHQNEGEPSDNYIGICTAGQSRNLAWPPPRLAQTKKLRSLFKDGKVHTVRVAYRPPILAVDFDDKENVLSVPVDLRTVLDDQGKAYIGFTASTGGGWANHDIVSWSFSSVAVSSSAAAVSSDITYSMHGCLPDRNLCTPDKAIVEEKAPGVFHVVLPAHLEWGASIPNPGNAAIEITNALGYVCWDPKTNECGSATSPPGTLRTRTQNGRTEFSVNDKPGAFKDNEGYFAFDVTIRR